jgi:hypothetical protein
MRPTRSTAGDAAGMTHRGLRRWLAAVVVVLGPVTVMLLYARAHLVWVVVLFGLLWSAGLEAVPPTWFPAAAPELDWARLWELAMPLHPRRMRTAAGRRGTLPA